MRIAAARGLAKVDDAGGASIASVRCCNDAVLLNVAVAILQALGGAADARTVAIALATELRRPDKTRVTAAAESLGRIAEPGGDRGPRHGAREGQ